MGTIDDNTHGPQFYSGDESGWRFGFAITCGGMGTPPARYDQSPLTNSQSLAVDMCAEADQGTQAQWMAWLDTNWSDMHDWLDGLSAADRSRCYVLCKRTVQMAQAFKDAGHLT